RAISAPCRGALAFRTCAYERNRPMLPVTSRSSRRALLPALVMIAAAAVLSPSAASAASQHDAYGPLGRTRFGEYVVVLTNGNYVVVDTSYHGPLTGTSGLGAVSLYDGRSDKRISTLIGSQPNDHIGIGLGTPQNQGIVEVGDSNFVVVSPQ